MERVGTIFERLLAGGKQATTAGKTPSSSSRSEQPVLEFSSKTRRRLSWCRCLVKDNW